VIKRKKRIDTKESQAEELEAHLLEDDTQEEDLEVHSPEADTEREDTAQEIHIEAVEEAAEGEGVEEAPREVTVEERINALLEEIERLQQQASEYLDGWQRERAEFANYKNRTAREKEETRAQITSEIIAKYLEILDDLELAIINRPAEDEAEAWVDGIELIHVKLNSLLEDEGVEVILAEGDTFDPNFHEAITYEENDDHQDGQVIEVVQKGYKLGDRVLRPAKVRVAK
jgi:molecular chaperone GrpE